MSDYSQVNDYSAKDALASGNPLKLIKGSDIDQELSAIAAAITSKYDDSDIANQATAEAGTSNTVLMTPLRTQQWGEEWAAENGGLIEDIHGLADPGADSILFWDDGAGAVDYLDVTPATSGLEISGTDLKIDIDSLTNVTPASGDEIVVADASDSGNPKAVLLSALATLLETDMNHDNLTGFVANEHVDHSTVSITAGTGLSGGGTIAANRTISLDHLGIEDLVNPGGDRLLMWDNSAGFVKWAVVGANLDLSGTTLTGDAPPTTQQIHAAAYYDYNGGSPVTHSSYNVASVSRSGTGVYVVNFTDAATDPIAVATVMITDSPLVSNSKVYIHVFAISTTSVTIRIIDDGASAVDRPFHVIVYDPA